MDINEIRKRAQQAREKAADSMKKTFEKSEELVNKIEISSPEKRRRHLPLRLNNRFMPIRSGK